MALVAKEWGGCWWGARGRKYRKEKYLIYNLDAYFKEARFYPPVPVPTNGSESSFGKRREGYRWSVSRLSLPSLPCPSSPSVLPSRFLLDGVGGRSDVA